MTHPLIPDASAAGDAASDDGSLVIQLGFTAEPIVDIGGSSEAPLYSECLARMMVADSVLLKSGDFVDDLEACGGIDLLDAAVVGLVLDALIDAPNVALGCNISPRTLSDPVAWKRVVSSIDERQWLAKRLTLEITETHPLNEIPDVAGRLAEVQRLGCRIAIDDFGAGYASANHLQGVDIKWDIVKIDRSCFGDLRDSPSRRTRLHSLVSQASRFAPIVVVEGIETYDRLSIAQEAGARFGQGWLFDGPVRDRWMMPGAASQLTAAMQKNRVMVQQPMRPAAPSGQATFTPYKRSLSANPGFSQALTQDVADLVWALVAHRRIGEAP
jgi:EAL domain-containing protein (putative c-di-GMP-specific phosphodiesterase class I)